ncbi:polynucleotide adenylyltransferase PcnB [Psychrobacter sp. M13]|uniref:polynucleotide adenylyltransferase PcnB n=1 Tax=Psychrobacter sp. M13 TaxID=3067275 RepID=UPI00273B121F|nr:polynucleotide adenylyltransferase PcnB [Psychrobacter sp. M13]WLP94681.1 polynucleotide adenylyltransferase PcnB [Psychrobacter sp. M13]
MAERAAKQLELNKSELPNSITEVIATLSRAGFDAYIVGGGVRDTLLGLRPKDFDAVTDAKPHEIKDVFGKRCRIIGRRFQLAHVYSGRELIEVATFRGPPNNDANTNQDGMIIRDNVWGDIKQDFARRDFSINALYYQPLKGVVHDFCGALEDIRNKTIRLLGNAPVRIEEDPVRLLRALRFKAKLGFEFDDELADQFHEGNWSLLEQISPHRLYDETQKMFTGGYLVPLLPLLFESGAIDSLIIYPPSQPNALVKQVAINTDKRINTGKSINPAFFYAALLWENYLHQLEKAKKRNMPFADAQMQAAGKVIERQRIKTAIPKFAEQFIRDIWILQPKLAAPRSKQIEQLAEHPRFRAGFDFLLLREQCGDAEHPLSESTNEMGDWWQTYQTLSEAQKQQAIEDFDEGIRRGAYKQDKSRRRDRSHNRQSHQNQTEQANSNDDERYINSSHKKTSDNEQPMNNENTNNGNAKVNNDPANVPTRRRRRTDTESDAKLDDKLDSTQSQQESSQKNSRANSSKSNSSRRKSGSKLTPREKHDSHELAQLQQLSLANNSIELQQDKGSTPAPLFVIEHANVVPPLKKQLAEPVQASDVKKTNAKAATKEATKEKPTSTSQAKDESDCSSSAKQAKPKRSTAAKATVAQTPKLVSINNEPIPHQRRRRQPSAEAIGADKATDTAKSSAAQVVIDAKPQLQPKAKSRPAKVSKSVSSDKAAKTSVDEQSNTSQKSTPNKSASLASNKGAVPAKRRRRQPSTDTTVSER